MKLYHVTFYLSQFKNQAGGQNGYAYVIADRPNDVSTLLRDKGKYHK